MIAAPDSDTLAGRRCVVLGAGGFIGVNLCRRLVADGAVVTGFGRRSRIADAAHGGAWIDGEFQDGAAIARALDGAEFVFHLLGGSNPSASNRDPGAELHHALADNLALVTAAARARVRKLVFVSSGGTVYGPAATLPITEDAATDPISAYGLGKLAAEKMLHLFRLIEGLDHAVLRVANPYGPFQLPDRAQGFVATVVKRALTAEPVEIWGDGSVVRDYLHVADVCDALVRAAAIDADVRVFNVGSGEGRSLAQIVASVGAVLGREVAVTRRPGRAADIPVNVLDATRARELLGWTPRVAWDDGVRETAAWVEGLLRG